VTEPSIVEAPHNQHKPTITFFEREPTFNPLRYRCNGVLFLRLSQSAFDPRTVTQVWKTQRVRYFCPYP